MIPKQMGDHKGTQCNDTETNGRPQGYAPTDTQRDDGKQKNKTIEDMMDVLKSIVTVEYIHGVKNWGWDRFDGKLLQRDYILNISSMTKMNVNVFQNIELIIRQNGKTINFIMRRGVP
jgi:hypothetical protein